MDNQYVLIAGLPRTGSTLLLNILLQNNKFHADSNSALCQMMWDTNNSINTSCEEQLKANKKLNTVRSSVLSSLPDLYYSNVSNKIVLDKCRAWTNEDNFNLAKKYIDKNIKVIILVRPIDEIVKSFAKLRKNTHATCLDLFGKTPEVLLNSYISTMSAINSASDNVMFLSYTDITTNTVEVLESIYNFIGVEKFDHDLDNIADCINEDVSVYECKDLHKIRNKISVDATESIIDIPDEFNNKAIAMSAFLQLELEGVYNGSFC